MKSSILGLIVAVISLITLTVPAQDIPKPERIDEFGKITCEDLLARIDHFRTHLSNNPFSTGMAIIRPQRNTSAHLWYKKLITSTFERNRETSDRLAVFWDKPSDSVGGSFWLVPPGADLQPLAASNWPDEYSDLSKPFIYATWHIEDPCPTFVPRVYGQLITNHPSIRAHIVVDGTSRKQQQRIARGWVKILTDEFNVPRARIKTFHQKGGEPGRVEFWIVPLKKQ